MCGINLIIDKHGKLGNSSIQLMNQATQHRGPDGSFHETLQVGRSKLHLGHNRLKIIDLSNQANQPFYSPDRQHVLLFNGEIYNYLTLKHQLKNKYPFSTQSDTEVLLYWLIEKGLKGIQELEGMFAFVWVDIRQQQVFFARDSFHIKPLFYFNNDQYLILSSEITGILDSDLVDPPLNETQITHYLTYKFAQPPQTFFQDVYQVASTMAFDMAKNQLTKVTLTDDAFEESKPIKVNDLETLLIQSVERQLQADVPVGVFLSGGIDSTLLLSITQELGIKHIPSFSIVNEANETNFGTQDYHYARLAATQFGSEHYEVQVKPSNLQGFDFWLEWLDQPIADSAIFLTERLSEFAGKTIKVALSGAGADELFGGYNRHRAFYQYLKNYRFFQGVSRGKSLASLLPDGFAHPLRKQMRLIKKLMQNIDSSPAKTFTNFTKLSNIPLNQPFIESSNLSAYPPNEHTQWLKWMLNYDQKHFLAQDVLALTDTQSMQHGLEVRVPYLSQKLYSSLQRFNPTDLLQKGRKSLLKEWLLKRDGQTFVNRPKEGFGMPFGHWLQQGKLPWIEDWLKRPNLLVYKWVHYENFQHMFKMHMKRKRDYTSEIWAVYLLSEWLSLNSAFYSS